MRDYSEIRRQVADLLKAFFEPAANSSQSKQEPDPSTASNDSEEAEPKQALEDQDSTTGPKCHEGNSEELLALLAASIRARAQHAAQMRFGAIVVIVSLFALVAAGLPFPVALSDRLLVAGFAVTTLIVGAWHFDRGNRALRRIGEDADEPQQ